MKPPRVAVPLWFVLAMLVSVAAIAALMVFIVAAAAPAPVPDAPPAAMVTVEEVGYD